MPTAFDEESQIQTQAQIAALSVRHEKKRRHLDHLSAIALTSGSTIQMMGGE